MLIDPGWRKRLVVWAYFWLFFAGAPRTALAIYIKLDGIGLDAPRFQVNSRTNPERTLITGSAISHPFPCPSPPKR